MLNKSYGFKPYYFTVVANSKLKALLPIMEVKTLFSGPKGVSLPFTDFCSPLVDSRSEFDDMFGAAVGLAKKKGWKTIDLRGGQEFLEGVAPSETFLTHVLRLDNTELDIQASFRDSTRRNIRKSEKQGVVAKKCNSLDAVKTFYSLHCLTRRRHGMPPQPLYFFEHLHAHIISKDMGCIILASINGHDAAGAVFLCWNGEIVFKYGASDKRYHLFRANHLTMSSAIHSFRTEKCNSVNFGRTEPGNTGLLQYKKGWGTEECTRHYYMYDVNLNSFRRGGTEIKSSYPLFKKMPLALLRFCGHLFYRFMG